MSNALESASVSLDINTFLECFNRTFQITIAGDGSAALAIKFATYLFEIHPMHWTVLANKPTFDVTNHTKHVNQLMQQLHAALLLQQCLEEKHSCNCTIFKLEELICLIDKCNTDSANNPPFLK